MKKLSVKMLTILGMAAIVFASSCKKDDENAPAPTITPQGFSAGTALCEKVGRFGDIKLRIQAEEKIGGLTITSDKGASVNLITATDAERTTFGLTGGGSPDGKKDVTINLKNHLNTLTTGDYEYTVTVTDKASTPKITTFKLKVTIVTLASNLLDATHSGKTLGAWKATQGSYFGVTTGLVYTSTQANNNISSVDFLFDYSGLTEANYRLLSWAARTATLGYSSAPPPPTGARVCYFRQASSSMTATQFTNATCDLGTFTVSTSDPQTIVVEAGKVYEFLTADGKYGLVHISAINGTESNSTAVINVKTAK
jgi:hypothetical protein